MDNKMIKSKAGKLRKEYWGTLLLSEVLLGIVAAIPLVGFVVAPTVGLGVYENYYNAYKGGETGWKRLYSKFEKQFESTFLYRILFVILAVVVGILILMLGVVLNMILSFIGVIVTVILLSFALLIIQGIQFIGFELLLLNPDMKGDEAFDETFRMITGYSNDYISLAFSYIGGILLTIITFGLYAIKFGPEITMAFVIVTDEIITEKTKYSKEEIVNPVTQAPEANNTQIEDKSVENNEENSAEEVSKGMFCPKCGTKNEEDAVFCEKCGNKLA